MNFRRNKPKRARNIAAVAAVVFIVLSLLAALLAHVIAPDSSRNTNRMIVELSARPPGYKAQLLKIPNRFAGPETETDLWSGNEDRFRYMPITQYRFAGEQVIVQHFIDDGLADTLSFPINELVPQSLHSAPLADRRAFIQKESLRNYTFWLGTDRYGRDIFSRLIAGARVSMSVGFVAVFLSLTIGIFLGALAGYYGGKIDAAVMFVINIFWSVPTMLLVFAVTLALGKGYWEIFAAIGLTMWVGTARLIRGQMLSLREADFVSAAKAVGASDTRIIVRHLLPNMASTILVAAAANFAAAILIEAGLSFLGIGVQPPQPSWGLMIKEHYNFLVTNRPLAAIIPGLAIMLSVYAFNILGNAARDRFDVRNK